jgi:hypothetical protein
MLTTAQVKKLPIGEYSNWDLYKKFGTQCLPKGSKKAASTLHFDKKKKKYVEVMQNRKARRSHIKL